MIDPQTTFQQIRQLKLTQDELKKQKFETTSGDIRVVVSGDGRVLTLELPKKMDEAANKKLKAAINKTLKKAQTSTLAAVKQLAE